ncbi:hypothetical protein PG991_015417 [Apiospora marii]|uniref:Uncharacterized protein n=1 Tax=Apiospora marii TaxID=335849 RepID=A0ABR1R1N4_9PEZI
MYLIPVPIYYWLGSLADNLEKLIADPGHTTSHKNKKKPWDPAGNAPSSSMSTCLHLPPLPQGGTHAAPSPPLHKAFRRQTIVFSLFLQGKRHLDRERNSPCHEAQLRVTSGVALLSSARMVLWRPDILQSPRFSETLQGPTVWTRYQQGSGPATGGPRAPFDSSTGGLRLATILSALLCFIATSNASPAYAQESAHFTHGAIARFGASGVILDSTVRSIRDFFTPASSELKADAAYASESGLQGTGTMNRAGVVISKASLDLLYRSTRRLALHTGLTIATSFVTYWRVKYTLCTIGANIPLSDEYESLHIVVYLAIPWPNSVRVWPVAIRNYGRCVIEKNKKMRRRKLNSVLPTGEQHVLMGKRLHWLNEVQRHDPNMRNPIPVLMHI